MIATILFVAVIAVFASVLYGSVGTMDGDGLIGPGGGHSCVGPQVRVEEVGSDWFVEIVSVARPTPPSGMFLEVRGPDGTVLLPRTSLSALTRDAWADRGAVYRDANSGANEVRPGDGIGLDGARFPRGSPFALSDVTGMLTTRILQ